MGANPQSGTEDAPYVSGAKTLQGMLALAVDWVEGFAPHVKKESVAPYLEQAERIRLIEKKSDGRWRVTFEGHRMQCRRVFKNTSFDHMVSYLRRWADGPIEMGMDAKGRRWVTVYCGDEQVVEREGATLEGCVELAAPYVREWCADEQRSVW